ncbi:E3 ubiquitin-protein ligase RING1-like [Ananas comosus]|uniref:RING-type E3 ubiquitin transferase n=1 Tax=Ananas comosus TaxID=4615 RepID=A0A199UDP0_ANACO|nr:E3 ubiquitin-protein ligase RING1-like [Ananas comosus]XP_020104251.1 E3 ubiquitin-protein ligase RING1-like [Ananas comosus]XP_020104252.1 E3 ubiquitin-protein ligase RING1-like [Ananas comosus]OAY62859.1 E3 ubiquitin-protein ligase RING1 [Ananas comosus]
MAPYPRLLYPWPSNATECSSDCSPSCAFYGLCSSPPHSSHPPPPLPPPPSPPPPPPHPHHPATSNTTTHRHHRLLSLSLSLSVSAASFSALFLLLLACCVASRLLRGRRRRSAAAAAGEGDGDFYEADHHVWYIRTVGLDEPTIEAIAAWTYKAGDAGPLGRAARECAVCLGEFRDGELLRLLPKCAHAFHLPCIDTWLRAHVNCPLCRAPIVAPPTAIDAAPPPPPSSSSPLPSSLSPLIELTNREEPDLGSSALIEIAQIDVGQIGNGEVENNGVIAPVSFSSSSSSSSSLGSSQVRLQLLHRSRSMDWSSHTSLIVPVELEEKSVEESKQHKLEEEYGSKSRGKQGSASKGVSRLQKSPLDVECIKMERSLSSSSSSRLLLSRHGRARSSVLPL